MLFLTHISFLCFFICSKLAKKKKQEKDTRFLAQSLLQWWKQKDTTDSHRWAQNIGQWSNKQRWERSLLTLWGCLWERSCWDHGQNKKCVSPRFIKQQLICRLYVNVWEKTALEINQTDGSYSVQTFQNLESITVVTFVLSLAPSELKALRTKWTMCAQFSVTLKATTILPIGHECVG